MRPGGSIGTPHTHTAGSSKQPTGKVCCLFCRSPGKMRRTWAPAPGGLPPKVSLPPRPPPPRAFLGLPALTLPVLSGHPGTVPPLSANTLIGNHVPTTHISLRGREAGRERKGPTPWPSARPCRKPSVCLPGFSPAGQVSMGRKAGLLAGAAAGTPAPEQGQEGIRAAQKEPTHKEADATAGRQEPGGQETLGGDLRGTGGCWKAEIKHQEHQVREGETLASLGNLPVSESWFPSPSVAPDDPSRDQANSVSSADEAIALGPCPARPRCAGTLRAWNLPPPAATLCLLPTGPRGPDLIPGPRRLALLLAPGRGQTPQP